MTRASHITDKAEPSADEVAPEPVFGEGQEFGAEEPPLAKASAPLPLPPKSEEPEQTVLNDGKPITPREETWADKVDGLKVREEAREKHIAVLHTMLDQAVEQIGILRAQLNMSPWHPDLTPESRP